MLNLANKIAIVTGCGSFAPGWGNAKAIATLFARQGATVIRTLMPNFIEALPRNANGKVSKPQLRELLAAGDLNR